MSLLPSLPTPNEEAFRYTSARIKVLETKLLAGSDFAKLKSLNKSEKISAIKQHYPWFDVDPIKCIKQSDKRLIESAYTFANECKHEDLANLFLLDKAMSQIQGHLESSAHSSTPVPYIERFLSSSNPNDLPLELQTCVFRADTLYKKNKKGDARRYLTSAMVSLAKTSRFSKLPYFREYFTHWGNLLEVRLFISSIIRKGTFTSVATSSMGLSKDTTLQELAKRLNVKDLNLQAIEDTAEERLFAHVTSARFLVCGPEVVFCYLFELSREFKNLSMLLASTQVFVPEKEISAMLMRPYVI